MIIFLSFLVSLFNEMSNDLEPIVEVINLAYQKQPFNRTDRTRITIAQLNEIVANPENHLYLLTDNGNVCGTILLNEWEISLFAIHPDFQGQGVGKQLLDVAEQEAFKTFEFVQLKVIPLFQEKLISYYEAMGYYPFDCETLSKEKLNRIQEQYHDRVYALVLRKDRSFF